MKKEINSKSKRKWVAGGLAAFASIALLTTGFATWVVGTQEDKKDASVNVTVDTAKNQTLTFDFSLSDSAIVLAEKAEVSVGFVKASGKEVVEKPLVVTIDKFVIKYGNDSVLKPTKVTFSIESSWNTVSENKIGEKRTGDSWTYLTAPTLELPAATGDEEGVKTITVASGKELTFSWGSFFGDKSPCEFYNEKFTNAADQTTENAQLIVDELTAMKKAFSDHGNTLTLRATLSADPA